MFHVYSGIFIKLHISRHIFPHWISDILRILALPVQGMQGSNVNQHLLFKSGSSFKSLFRSIWNIFLNFVSKVNIQEKIFRIVFQQ